MERVAIVGTAQSWTQTPWNDPGLKIWSLNDAYRMKGFVRADAWFDLHPMDKFFTVEDTTQRVYAHQVPPGFYVRPKTHKDWLGRQAQTIPVWLHPDYRTQHPEAAAWPQARAFPKADIEAEFGRYFTSSPAWMLALAIQQGAKEVHVYGIHLATEHEYIEQRPNFEYLCGRVLGPSRVKTTISDGLRRYETHDGIVVLPEASPVLASDFQYAFQDRPRAHLEPLKWDQHRYTVKRDRAIHALRDAKWYQRMKPLQDAVWQYEALVADTQDQLGRVTLAQQLRSL